jgi:LysR family glycine cleavage system transcriptional activator
MSKPHTPSRRPAADPGALPSLTALQAFDAALRHRSFTQAARELGCTQGAVSRQVASLEQALGRELFHREHPAVRPTRVAEELGRKLRGVLERLTSIVREAQSAGEDGGVLDLALLPTFGTTWLIPRLKEFLRAHPQVAVHVTTSLHAFDFETEDLDAAIHYGEGVWPGARSEPLFDEQVMVVAAPEVARGLRTPADLAQATLLQLSSRPEAWQRWLDEWAPGAVDGRRGPRFEHHLMVLAAARAGLGWGLLPDFVATEALADGAVVEPFPGTRSRTLRKYWLVYPERSLELPALHAFRGWLREELRRDGRTPAP